MRFALRKPQEMLLLAGAVLLLLVAAVPVVAQSSGDPCKADRNATDSYATIRLVHMNQSRDAMEVATALRNVLPCAKIYYVSPQNTLSVSGSPASLEQARKLVAELDQPRASYRITFTLAQLEAGKRVAVRKYSMVLWGNERSSLKQGQRIPITTGSDKKESSTAVQVQYVDVGLSLQASIEGTRLATKVEESAVASPSGNPQEPTIAQMVLEGSQQLKVGTPVVLGSLDVPGTTHREEVEVLLEAIN